MADERMRAADVDRERVVERLRRAQAEGRISLVEFDERVAAAYGARTYGDLAPLTSDLPAESVAGRAASDGAAAGGPGGVGGSGSVVGSAGSASAGGGVADRSGSAGGGAVVGGRARSRGRRLAWRIEAASWLFASLVNLLIWGVISLATGAAIYPWWVWVAGPWGAVLLFRAVTGRALCRAA